MADVIRATGLADAFTPLAFETHDEALTTDFARRLYAKYADRAALPPFASPPHAGLSAGELPIDDRARYQAILEEFGVEDAGLGTGEARQSGLARLVALLEM
jgi:hypothetical protein